MSETWRYVDCGLVDAYTNAAQLPVLIRSMLAQSRPLVMTSAWGATHLNVGWFDDVDSTLDLEACRRLGVQVVRRQSYGGGTAFYDEGCAVMWTFILPKEGHEDMDAELARFQPVLLDTLGRLDLGAVAFEGSSDLRFEGRKLGALAAQDLMVCLSIGGFLNVAPPDIDLYLKVVRIPEEKFRDKVVKDLREYVATAEDVRGRPLGYQEFQEAFLAALGASGITVSEEPLGDGELRGLAKVAAKVSSDEALRRVSSERFAEMAPEGSRVGFGNHKGRKLCRAGVALDAGSKVIAAMLAGDMHVSPPDVMDRVAAALVGADVGGDLDVFEPDLRQRIAGVFEAPEVHQAEASMGVTTEDLLAAVEKAVADALPSSPKGGPRG